MQQEIFTDGISAVHVTGNLVRIDLMTVQPHLKSDNGQPVIDVSRRIIMSLEGFVYALAVQENIVRQLIDAGVLKKNPPEPADEREGCDSCGNFFPSPPGEPLPPAGGGRDQGAGDGVA